MIEIRNCFFLGNEAPEAAAIDVGYCWDGVPRITNNTFIGNNSLDAPIHFDRLDAYITNNIFPFNQCLGRWVCQLGKCGCNLFWGNRTWGLDETCNGAATAPGAREGVQRDHRSRVLQPARGDYTLTATSPGLPANFTELFREQGCEGLVGAFGMGCQVSPTQDASWGELKRLFGGAESDSAGRPSTSGAGQK
ncbi:MAG: hypothetical protein IPK72_22330 [Candidatus Eisenbacteria bacterium]|nr:hypothetical protein [Candidatus Eisenbacteria bacterium]